MGDVCVNSIWSIFKTVSSELLSLMTWFVVPLCLAVSTRFLRRTKQQQQILKISGLSAIIFSIDRASIESSLTWSCAVDFDLSLKHDEGMIYIFSNLLNFEARFPELSQAFTEIRTTSGRSVLLLFVRPIFSYFPLLHRALWLFTDRYAR